MYLPYVPAITGLTCAPQLISSLHRNCRTFERKLTVALQSVPSHLLALPPRTTPADFPSDILSPIFPILTTAPIPLGHFLCSLGYRTRPLPYPVVPRGQERVRVVMHARNTEEELDELIARLLEWSSARQEEEQREKAKQALLAAEEVVTRRSEPPKDKSLFTISLPGTPLRIDISVRSFV